MVNAAVALSLCTLAALRAIASAGSSSDCEGCEAQTSLLQVSLEPMQMQLAKEKQVPAIDPHAKLSHYWPSWRGQHDQYSVASYPILTDGKNLSNSLLWSHDFTMADKLFGAIIDNERNIYVSGMLGLRKMSPTGEILWTHELPAFFSVLVGNAVCSQNNLGDRFVYCLSQKTGEMYWGRSVFPEAGHGENAIEAKNGRLFVTGGVYELAHFTVRTGKANDRIIALDAATGAELWQFVPHCGLWSFAPVFPDADSMVFHDMCGGLYRMAVKDGSVSWHAPGLDGTISDAAAALGGDDSMYACFPDVAELTTTSEPQVPSFLRKVSLSTGAELWRVKLFTACAHTPAVSADGKTVVIAPGAIPPVDGPFFYYRWQTRNLPPFIRQELKKDYDGMARNGTLRAFFNASDLSGGIMGFSAATGSLQFNHSVPAWGFITAAKDQERNWQTFILRRVPFLTLDVIKEDIQNKLTQPHCIAAHWSGAVLDRDGTVYIGESSGKFRVYNPTTDVELNFETGDAVLPPGPASAPGMMVFATCQHVFVFRAQGA